MLVAALETEMHYHSAHCDATGRPLFCSLLNSGVKKGANFYLSLCIKLTAQETGDSSKIVVDIGKAIPRKANTKVSRKKNNENNLCSWSSN